MNVLKRVFGSSSTDFEEVLQGFEKQITASEARQRALQLNKSRFARFLFLTSVAVYIALALWLYYLFVFHLLVFRNIATWAVSLVAYTVVAVGLHKLGAWYYSMQLKRELANIDYLRAKRKEKLEELKAKTDFYRMQRLVEKYDEPRTPTLGHGPVPPTPTTAPRSAAAASAAPTPIAPSPRPVGPGTAAGLAPLTPATVGGPSVPATPRVASTPRGATLAAVTPPSVATRERTLVDKLVDFITGDGPNNRYALICPHCKLHNGLVLPQDLATIRYMCPRCGQWNRAPDAGTPPTPAAALPTPAHASSTPADAVDAAPAARAVPARDAPSAAAGTADSDGAPSGEASADTPKRRSSRSRGRPAAD